MFSACAKPMWLRVIPAIRSRPRRLTRRHRSATCLGRATPPGMPWSLCHASFVDRVHSWCRHGRNGAGSGRDVPRRHRADWRERPGPLRCPWRHAARPGGPNDTHTRHCLAHHAPGQRSRRRRSGPGLGEQEQQSLPLPRRPLLRQDEAGRVHDRGGRQGGWGARQRREGVLLTAARRR